MKTHLLVLATLLLSGLAAVPTTSATGFCDLFQPPPQGPACVVADEAIGEVHDTQDHVGAIVDVVYGIAWNASEGARCIVIKALGGTC